MRETDGGRLKAYGTNLNFTIRPTTSSLSGRYIQGENGMVRSVSNGDCSTGWIGDMVRLGE